MNLDWDFNFGRGPTRAMGGSQEQESDRRSDIGGILPLTVARQGWGSPCEAQFLHL